MPLLKFGGAPAAKEELPPPPPPEPMPEQKDRRSVLQRLIQEMAAAPQSPNEWMDWGDGHGLDPEYDNDGQLIYYTDDPAAAKDAERLGADIEGDRTGQYVIYTNAEMDGPGDAEGDFVDAGIRGREMMKRR